MKTIVSLVIMLIVGCASSTFAQQGEGRSTRVLIVQPGDVVHVPTGITIEGTVWNGMSAALISTPNSNGNGNGHADGIITIYGKNEGANNDGKIICSFCPDCKCKEYATSGPDISIQIK